MKVGGYIRVKTLNQILNSIPKDWAARRVGSVIILRRNGVVVTRLPGRITGLKKRVASFSEENVRITDGMIPRWVVL